MCYSKTIKFDVILPTQLTDKIEIVIYLLSGLIVQLSCVVFTLSLKQVIYVEGPSYRVNLENVLNFIDQAFQTKIPAGLVGTRNITP